MTENTITAAPAASLGPLNDRAIMDAIRGAYDLGYADARNARTVPGDSAPGYKCRDVERDHGGALIHALSRALAAPAAQEAEPAVPGIQAVREALVRATDALKDQDCVAASLALTDVERWCDRAAVPRHQADAGAVPVAQDQYLCQTWGETDLPVAAIVDGLEGVRAFLVAQWLGSEDAEADDGTRMLPAAMDDMQDNWQLEGKAWKWSAEFEIGGISVQKVWAAAAPQAPAAAVELPEAVHGLDCDGDNDTAFLRGLASRFPAGPVKGRLIKVLDRQDGVPSEDECIEAFQDLTGMHLWSEGAHCEVVRKMRSWAARWADRWAPAAAVAPAEDADAVDVVGVRANGEHVSLGKMPMPPRMKAREIAASQFGRFVDDDGSDAELCFGAMEELLDWLERQRCAAAPTQEAAPHLIGVNMASEPAIEWPKARDVGRIGDMSPSASLRVGLDSDNDVFVSVWGEDGGGSVEFCNGGGGGGRSMRTRQALIALMVAMEQDNAERPDLDWWALRMGGSKQEGGAT